MRIDVHHEVSRRYRSKTAQLNHFCFSGRTEKFIEQELKFIEQEFMIFDMNCKVFQYFLAFLRGSAFTFVNFNKRYHGLCMTDANSLYCPLGLFGSFTSP